MQDELEFDLTLYPDPVLRKRAQEVAVDDALRATVRAMLRRMYASGGVGLAAPQVGLRQRVLVLNETGNAGEGEELALVNPRILERSGPPTVYEEGCLSFPQLYAEVERPERCRVAYTTPEGEAVEREFEGFTSRIVQHEYDHLEGVLLVDRMSPADKHRHRAALEELVRKYQRAVAAAKR